MLFIYYTVTKKDKYVPKNNWLLHDYYIKYNTSKVIIPYFGKLKRQISCHYKTSDNTKLTKYMKGMHLKILGFWRSVLDLNLSMSKYI